MCIEQTIKEQTEKIIETIKEQMESEGVPMDSSEEMFFRTGISYGIRIAGLVLSDIDTITTKGHDEE